jgi:hypothetical protein
MSLLSQENIPKTSVSFIGLCVGNDHVVSLSIGMSMRLFISVGTWGNKMASQVVAHTQFDSALLLPRV